MNEQFAELMSECEVCNRYKTEQQKEPFVCRESPTRTWESMAPDLFVFHGKDYLVTTILQFFRSEPTVFKVEFRRYYQDEGTYRDIWHTQQAYVRQWPKLLKERV